MCAATYASDVLWFRNEDGNGTAWSTVTVDAALYGVSSVGGADVDGDGDTDIIASGTIADGVFWYRNDGGTGESFTKITIASGAAEVRCPPPARAAVWTLDPKGALP